MIFAMNGLCILYLRKGLKAQIPYKAREEYIKKFKKIQAIKNFLFYSLAFYQCGFSYLIYWNYFGYNEVKFKILPVVENILQEQTEKAINKYEEFFMLENI